ncbi:MAG: ATP-dependent DNA helicase [Candidatus Woesearchaeota archaeon]
MDLDMEEYPEEFDSLVKEKRDVLLEKSQKKIAELDDPFLFPYESMRDAQKKLIEDISGAVSTGKHIFAHAPTGLGKTIASIGPALSYCMKHKKILFFLTSRQTQHIMGVKTLRDIQNKFGLSLEVLDLIGKKSMCLQEGIENLSNSDFSEFCKNAKKQRTCEYYNNTRKSDGVLKTEAQFALSEMQGAIMSTEQLVENSRRASVCPYEMALAKAETAQVIISDYFYIFHPNIRELLFRKLGITLDDCVIIVDEAHNLPDRVKSLASAALSSNMLDRALQESTKHGFDEASVILSRLRDGLVSFDSLAHSEMKGESSCLLEKHEFVSLVKSIGEYESIIGTLEEVAELVRSKQKRSYIGGIANFLIMWQGEDEGFARIFSKDVKGRTLKYECLDPSSLSSKVFDESHSVVVISGTLEPLEMYADLLGATDPLLKRYENPFPKENALSLIVPITTTKFTRRGDEEFQKIAAECEKILSSVKGNSAFFFPSYFLRDKVYKYLYDAIDRDFILESASASKEQKADILKSFTESSLQDKVLLATSSGSFGEGIDLPGHFLQCVVVIGLPLKKPTLEVKQLIAYYEKKFGRGWDYGYYYPSFNTTFQNVGRCIRSETDKGVMIYLDERFAEKRYLKYFGDRKKVITYDYITKIKEFQSSNRSSSSKPSSSDLSGSISSL